MEVSKIISGGNTFYADNYNIGENLIIDGIQYRVSRDERMKKVFRRL